MPTDEALATIRGVREALAGAALTAPQAKLYSQRLRRDMGREGLATFTVSDIASSLDEAAFLIECGLIESAAQPNGSGLDSLERAAEILEWLSQPNIRPSDAPIPLLAAAAYQVAGFPAMALGLLRATPEGDRSSRILQRFLQADFPGARAAVVDFWRERRSARLDDGELTLTDATFLHIIMCIGVVCDYLRLGEHALLERALSKLDSLAKSALLSRDSYSYILAQLTSLAARKFTSTCLWPRVRELGVDAGTSAALKQFGRASFRNRRLLVWPAQAKGIERLRHLDSFVLCTPTGSGKTTIATLAIVQSLFGARPALDGEPVASLVLYVVPSRALAAEVEARVSQDLAGVAADPIVVTGLYGGVDWGPTDAWIQSDRPSIVICTFEKADALLRYLGILFLHRVRLVVIDEAHSVERDPLRSSGTVAESRSLRLEQLGARLLSAQDTYGFRMVALSAVAASSAPALARWMSSGADVVPVSSNYRSTRQMIGRLEVSASGEFGIYYALMNGHSLAFQDGHAAAAPYVPRPFARLPGGVRRDQGPDLRMRGPTLWAALHLAAERPDGGRPSVLISITQQIEGFAATCLQLMEDWQVLQLPNYRAAHEGDAIWERCLASARDYFGEASTELRLLVHGIAVHHGKMPSLLARRLKVVIDAGLVRVIIATSTLSEGVNIPVNHVLLPSLHRGNRPLSLQEFSNLVGRAGRPGVATEGSALVVLEETQLVRHGRGVRRPRNRQRLAYDSLVAGIEHVAIGAAGEMNDDAHSPLAELLQLLRREWQRISGGGGTEFEAWLDETATVGAPESTVIELLDTPDGFLLAAVQEVEDLRVRELTPVELEGELQRIWRRTYAFASAADEVQLEATWLRRGKALRAIYPDPQNRKRVYKTSLAPRSAARLLDIEAEARTKLTEGAEYAIWETEQRLAFIEELFRILSVVPAFHISAKLGRRQNFTNWPELLRWWLARSTLRNPPRPNQITAWFQFVSQNFIHRGVWGLGALIAAVLEAAPGEPVRALEIADWPRSGLPWIAFWLKELVTWGTLDPVAAFLLARGDAIDRGSAEASATEYYALHRDADPNELLDPRAIREWADTRRPIEVRNEYVRDVMIQVDLNRPVDNYAVALLSVIPLPVGDRTIWIDAAGYTVATSLQVAELPARPEDFEFYLDVRLSVVTGQRYLAYV